MRAILICVICLFVISLPATVLTFDMLFSNDIHGGIDRYPATFMNPEFPPMLGGGGSAATYIKSVRDKSDGEMRSSFLFDAGDFFQGHPVGTMTDGRAVITYMNDVGYDALTIGNHEFDIGEERLLKTLELASFPILSCNIVKKGTQELVDYVKPYIIREKLGIKFGIIGLTTTDTAKMSFPDHIKNVDFLNAVEALKKYIPIVRKQCDILIVVGHMGLPYNPEADYKKRYLSGKKERTNPWGYDAQEVIHHVEGIDIFFGGHMHKGFAEAWVDPNNHTLAFQGYAYGSGIGHTLIKIDEETKSIIGYDKPAVKEGVMTTLFEDEFIPDIEISAKILEEQVKAEEGMDEILGIAEINLTRDGSGTQHLVGNFVVQAMKESVEADFAFINLGGVRGDISAGPITHRSIFDVMPFDNQVLLFEVDGYFVKKIIEARVSGTRHGLRIAGISVVVNRKREDYDKVTSLKIDGLDVIGDKIYKVATTDFLMQGNAGLSLLTEVPESQITRTELSMRDAMALYVKTNSPVSSVVDNRWIKDNKSIPSKSVEALNKD